MGPRGLWEVKTFRFRDIGNWRWYVVSHSQPAVFTPRRILVLILRGWINPGHTELSDATEPIPSDTTGYRSRDLPNRPPQAQVMH
jgi:hypothetical protein